ncbi:hypothetical protein EVAR_4735_1 [Eumeta japonica]|uniref:Uncharacterized protein n=1 Tax=Eumeta variegata TaxID=151549 RepID=A0A4C1SZI0_EUMVA|nr:hypothetical protein EVAR_4735_1 [Eumeta japonica]
MSMNKIHFNGGGSMVKKLQTGAVLGSNPTTRANRSMSFYLKINKNCSPESRRATRAIGAKLLDVVTDAVTTVISCSRSALEGGEVQDQILRSKIN